MSQKPRGRNEPRQAWGNQPGGGGNNNGNNSRRGQQGQNAPSAAGAAPNFADSNAFGPPLGGRARPNRQGGKHIDTLYIMLLAKNRQFFVIDILIYNIYIIATTFNRIEVTRCMAYVIPYCD